MINGYRLVSKLMNKIFQLNLSVKDKLIDLNIFEKTKDLLKNISQFEETLKAYSQKNNIDIEFTLSYISKNFRIKFQKELTKLNISSENILNNLHSSFDKEDSSQKDGLHIIINTESDKRINTIIEKNNSNNDDRKFNKSSENLTNHRSSSSINSIDKSKSNNYLLLIILNLKFS